MNITMDYCGMTVKGTVKRNPYAHCSSHSEFATDQPEGSNIVHIESVIDEDGEEYEPGEWERNDIENSMIDYYEELKFEAA